MRYMRKIILCCLFALLCLTVSAQKEANNWYFGANAGITWNVTRSVAATGLSGTPNATLTGLPTNVAGSQIVTQEGCFSLSDYNGNLLFYSDGTTIWNRNNAIMSNGSGLTGDYSSAQSGIILPYPGTVSRYIAVTLGQYIANNLSYSIVDMTLDGGLGAVESAQKNILFKGNKGLTGESVSSIRHANKRDYWVVAPGRGPTTYLNSWLVTSAGVASQPVITEFPIETPTTSGNICGYFKFTSDGKHFAWAGDTRSTSLKIMFGDFDNTTGQFSNLKTISFATGYPYGLEFSQSNKYLYLGRRNSTLEIYDFEALLAAADPSTVVPKIHSFSYNGALQMAPDGRIYAVASGYNYLYVIDNPDEGTNIKFYRLPSGFLTGIARSGLPSFAASWFGINLSGDQTPCVDGLASYSSLISYSTLDPRYDNLRYFRWNWGDGTAVENDYNISVGTIQTRTHTYRTKGTFKLSVTPYVEDTPGVFTPLTDIATSIDVVPRNCVLPVNPHVRTGFIR